MKQLIILLLVLAGCVGAVRATEYTVYFRPNSQWKQDNANFGLYMYNDTENTFSLFQAVSETGAYYVTFDTKYTKCNFVRLKSGTTTLGDGWSNKDNQSGDIAAPTADNTYYDMSDLFWSGVWSNSWTESNIHVRNLSQSWYIAGGRHITGGFYEWSSTDEAKAANTMTTTDNIDFTFSVAKRPIKAGTYEFKFVGDDWVGDGSANGSGSPDYNYTLTIASDGVYDITYSFNQLSRTGSVSAVKDDSDESTITYKYYLFDENSTLTGKGWYLNELTDNGEANTVAYTIANPLNLKNGTTYRYKVAEQILKGSDVVNTYWPWNSEGSEGWWTLTVDMTRAYNVTIKFVKNANFKMTSSNPSTTATAETTGFYVMYDNGSGWYVGNLMTVADGVYTGTITGLNNGQYFAILPAGNLPSSETTVSNWSGVIRPNRSAEGQEPVLWSVSNSGGTTTNDNSKTWINNLDGTVTLAITYNSNNSTWSVVPQITGSISTAGYATYSHGSAYKITGEGVGVYTITATAAGEATMSSDWKDAALPAGTGVVLTGSTSSATEYTVTPSDGSASIGTNLLVGSGDSEATITVEDGYEKYILANKTNGVKFYKWDGSSADNHNKLGAHKAYLKVSTGVGAPEFFNFDFGGETTDIENTVKSEEIKDKSFFNLAGQRVAQPSKGLYIVNGKKVVLK